MRLRFSRLRWPEWVVGAGGLVLLASMLPAPWYRRVVSSGPKYLVPESVDDWHGLGRARWLTSMTVLDAFAVVFFQARQPAPALPVTATAFTFPLATATGVWLIVRASIAPPGGREIDGRIALLGAAAVAYGGYKSIRMEGIAETDAPRDIPTVDLERERATGLGRGGAT